MNIDRLLELGFNVAGPGDDPKLSVELILPLMNPLSRKFIEKVGFKVRDGRLVAVEPPEVTGLQPFSLTGVEHYGDFEAQLHMAYDDAVLKLQRRSAELQALGLHPHVDPKALTLTAIVVTGTLILRIAADKLGGFRVLDARRGEEKVPLPSDPRFELSEFREGRALSEYLEALVTEGAPPRHPPAPAAQQTVVNALTLRQLKAAFGGDALVPQKTPVEIVIDLRVGKDRYRFAASRVVGSTFRGLLAGPRGKVWADRFELENFPGPIPLLAAQLGVPKERVERADGP